MYGAGSQASRLQRDTQPSAWNQSRLDQNASDKKDNTSMLANEKHYSASLRDQSNKYE